MRSYRQISPLLYGHFIEHFHRQVYGGIFDPENPLSDRDGFRADIIGAMRQIRVPVLRWPGGCFVSSYHWKDAVGPARKPAFDKAWRVEDPNTFGTDEYIKLCRKIGCEPYICTNAGTGTSEEMSDWVEYCNLADEGQYAKMRIANGFAEPHKVKYWSIGNENYGHWEIGAKVSGEWGRLVRESAKMIKRVDPTAELSAAALSDVNWTLELLQSCGPYLDWISIHQYWDMMPEVHAPANYEQCMAYTAGLSRAVDDVRGILTALHLEDRIKIAFDEWNLRSWHHPNVHTVRQGVGKETYVTPRDKNDDNSTYTMADTVFTACFLSAMIRNCDIVGMANFAPILNTRGCIYSYDGGLVLRSTYHVFDLYVNHMGDTAVDLWCEEPLPEMTVRDKAGRTVTVPVLDLVATRSSDGKRTAIAAVNKHISDTRTICFDPGMTGDGTVYTVNGPGPNAYNDVGRDEVNVTKKRLGPVGQGFRIDLAPHSVNVIEIERSGV